MRADLVVVGAGPAGLAAAAAAGARGLAVVLLDAGPDTGGQYWRNAAAPITAYHGVRAFRTLSDQLRTAGVVHMAENTVQVLQRDGELWRLTCAVGREPRARDARMTSVLAPRVVLATGAYDRQVPFPGWDLPGVLAAGGVQAMQKAHGVLPGRRVVVAGTGPFLLSVADGLLRGGASVAMVAEASSPVGFARHPHAVVGAAGKLGEAAGYAAILARHRVLYRRRHAVVRALGDDRLSAVEVARLDADGRVMAGSVRRVECDVLAVGWGFTPQLELALQAGCDTALGVDGALVVTASDTQLTSADSVWAAGEVTGVGGADLAVVEGRIAGLAAAGAPVGSRLLARRDRLRAFADALHRVHPVPSFLVETLPDDALVCRCEEVPAGRLRKAVTEWGATDMRTAKLLSRCGMGWCQGRVCGWAAAQVVADACRRAPSVSDLRSVSERPLATPLPLGALIVE